MRSGPRKRILAFFAAITAGSLTVLAVGLWFGYHRNTEPQVLGALLRTGIATGSGLIGLLVGAWLLFDKHVARPVEQIAAAMRVRAHADVTERMEIPETPHLGDLSTAAAAAAATLDRARNNLAETVARETSRLLADKGKLEQMLSDVPPAVLLCTGRHHLVFYNSVAQHLLGSPDIPVCLDRSLFDYLDDGAIRHAHRRLLEAAMPDAIIEFVCSLPTGGRRLAGRIRLAGDNDGDVGAYVMTLRDVTAEITAFARRDILLNDIFVVIRPVVAALKSAAETSRDGAALRLDHDFAGLDRTMQELEHRFEACQTAGWPSPFAGIRESETPLQSLEPSAAKLPRTVTYDFDLLSRASYDKLADALLDDLTYVVFDTETTGLLPEQGDELVQIAAVRIVNGRIVQGETFETLVNPGRPIPAAASAIHRVTDTMVTGAPSVLDVVERFHRFVGNAVLVAHNAPFDMAFLYRHENALGIQFDNPVLDTGHLSIMIFGPQESHTLDAITRRLSVHLPEALRHTAMGDAAATAEVFVKLKSILAARGIRRFSELKKISRAGKRPLA